MSRLGRCWVVCALVLAAVGASAVCALAQGTARSMDIPVSIRSVGMGGTGDAMCWGELDYWANPALLGYAQGVRYVHSRTQLVPGLASDVFFTTDAVQWGGGGLGVVSAGPPLDRGGVHLDYGLSEGRDESGAFTGTFGSWETVESWGGGIRVVRALDGIVCALSGRDPGWSRHADVSFGMNSKHATVQLAPGALDDTWARDWGVHARVTPIDGLDAATGPPLRVDVAYAWSVLSYNDDATMQFTFLGGPSPVTRHHRWGEAVHVAAGRLETARRQRNPMRRVILEGLAPLVSLTAAGTHADIGHFDVIDYKTDGGGGELTLANVLTGRWGYYQDRDGQIDGATWGWGVGLPIGRMAGARYDEAWWPQAKDSGLHHAYRRQFSAWIDVLELRRVLDAR